MIFCSFKLRLFVGFSLFLNSLACSSENKADEKPTPTALPDTAASNKSVDSAQKPDPLAPVSKDQQVKPGTIESATPKSPETISAKINPADFDAASFASLIESPMPPLPCGTELPTLYKDKVGGCTQRVAFVSGRCEDLTHGFSEKPNGCADECKRQYAITKSWFKGSLCLVRDKEGIWVALKHKEEIVGINKE